MCHSLLNSFALRLLFLQTHAPLTKEKGVKPDGTPYPLPYGLRNPYRNLKYENSQDYAQKPQRNCMFMNSAFELSLSSPLPQKSIAKHFTICFIFISQEETT
jgi:hypothetical protein